MAVVNNEIIKIVFVTLLSLSIYGIVGQILEWGSEKSPWDTKKTKFIVLIIVATISSIYLLSYFKKKDHLKAQKYSKMMSAGSISPNKSNSMGGKLST